MNVKRIFFIEAPHKGFGALCTIHRLRSIVIFVIVLDRCNVIVHWTNVTVTVKDT